MMLSNPGSVSRGCAIRIGRLRFNPKKTGMVVFGPPDSGIISSLIFDGIALPHAHDMSATRDLFRLTSLVQ